MGKAKRGQSRRRNPDRILDRLDNGEASRVLRMLLDQHPDLEVQAVEHARTLLATVDVEVIAEEVADVLLGVEYAEMNARAERRGGGYIDPSQAAWEALEEAAAPFIADLTRLLDLGFEDAAIATGTGIVLGLYALREPGPNTVLEWVPDFPLEMAVDALTALGRGGMPGFPDFLTNLATEVPEWADALRRAGRER